MIRERNNLRRVVLSSLVGAVIEWYDFFLYGVVAGLVFNKLFFPEFSEGVGTILAFATFAVGFVARPLGGMIFGHFGDKIGRKKMLILTLQIMGASTVLIGLDSLVRGHRHMGSHPAGDLPSRPGNRSGRGMGRRGAHDL